MVIVRSVVIVPPRGQFGVDVAAGRRRLAVVLVSFELKVSPVVAKSSFCVAVPLRTCVVAWTSVSIASSWRSIVIEVPVAPVPVIVPFTSVIEWIEATVAGVGINSEWPEASRRAYDRVIVRPFTVTGAQSKR